MHYLPFDSSDTWALQEKVVYSFQHSQCSKRQAVCSTTSHTVPPATRSSGSPPPRIILLCLWPKAGPSQIQRYISGYRELYPSAKLIISHTRSGRGSRADEHEHEQTLNELIDAQPQRVAFTTSRCTTVDGSNTAQRPLVLLHLFGTSGAAGACDILRSFRLRTGAPLNVGAVVADTEPSASLTTFLTSSRPFSSAFFSLILAFWMRLQEYMFFWPPESHSGQVHRDLNDPSLLPSEAQKCFIFAHRGLMLTWIKNSVPHAGTRSRNATTVFSSDEQDERREYAFRRSSVDQKGRWTGDQERYWSGIAGVWEGR